MFLRVERNVIHIHCCLGPSACGEQEEPILYDPVRTDGAQLVLELSDGREEVVTLVAEQTMVMGTNEDALSYRRVPEVEDRCSDTAPRGLE